MVTKRPNYLFLLWSALSLPGAARTRRRYFNTAGGSPAAGDFLLLAQKKVTEEKGTLLRRPSGSLRCSRGRAAAELAHEFYSWMTTWAGMCCGAGTSCALAQSSPTTPGRAALLGGSEGREIVSCYLLHANYAKN